MSGVEGRRVRLKHYPAKIRRIQVSPLRAPTRRNFVAKVIPSPTDYICRGTRNIPSHKEKEIGAWSDAEIKAPSRGASARTAQSSNDLIAYLRTAPAKE
jgi:hypothetical protein